jgi:hypothetical protein
LLYFAFQSAFNMGNKTNPADDIQAIRKLMEESSRFLSLSGLSGVLAGLAAIAGALVVYFLIPGGHSIHLEDYLTGQAVSENLSIRLQLLVVASVVLLVALVGAFCLSAGKAKKAGKNFWSPASRRMVMHLFIPLAAGGLFVIALLMNHFIPLIVPGLLIFYGLALVNAGKFTLGEIFYLGILQIIVGLIAAFVPGYDLLFWSAGFGVLHIVYGLVMYRKYEA